MPQTKRGGTTHPAPLRRSAICWTDGSIRAHRAYHMEGMDAQPELGTNVEKWGSLMNRQSLVVGVTIMTFVACGVFSGKAAAQMETGQSGPRTIRVSGVGEVRVEPDLATIEFAVETTGITAHEAGQVNAAAMDRVIQALVAAGVTRDNIRTSGYALYPEYAQPARGAEAEAPRITGYRAMNQVSARSTDLEGLGRLIDAGLAAGANRMNGVSFEIENSEQARSDALRRAVEAARASAETIASALGLQLGQVLDASTSSDPIQPMYREVALQSMDARGGYATATPIEPGEQTVRAVASVTYGIQ